MSARHPTKRAEDTGARKRQDSSFRQKSRTKGRVGRPFRLVRARVIMFRVLTPASPPPFLVSRFGCELLLL